MTLSARQQSCLPIEGDRQRAVRGPLIDICSVLDDQEFRWLNDIVTEVRLDIGRTLFVEGDPSDFIFGVTRGALRVCKLLPDGRRQIFGFMFPGDFVGLAADGHYSYTVETITRANLCRFRRSRFNTFLEQVPKLRGKLLALVTDELMAAQDQILSHFRKSARERLATFLVHLSKRAVRLGQPAYVIYLPMVRGDIGDYLGLSVETVSRTLSNLRHEGIIALPDPHRVVLLEMDALYRLATAS